MLLSYNSKKVELDCGTGAGGFKSGNTCAKGGGSSPDLLGKKLVEKIKRDNPKADVAKEAVRMGVNAVVKAVRGAKVAGQYGASKTADIVRWLGTESGKQFLGAVGRTMKITGVGAIGALRGLKQDRFAILGTAIFAPQFVPFFAGRSALKGFFKGAIEEYNSEGSGRQISNAIRSSIGRPEFKSADKAINLQEDPKPEDIIDYLADVLAVSIKDYIEDKNDLSQTNFQEGDSCPLPTQDIKTNLENRQKAIDVAHYGPANPKEPNDEYWSKKAKIFGGSVKEAKTMLCGNCAGFNKTKRLMNCISKGIGYDAQEVEQAGDLGYCEIFDFKCASLRTCDAWIVGGPIQDKKELNCGTGSGGFKEGNTCAKGRESGGIFVSPSIKEDSSFKDAIKMISSSEHARSVSMAKDIVKDQGMEGDFKSAVGDWEDGAENAIKIEVKNAQDFDQIAYTAAKLGSLMKQKAVIAFQNKNDGQDSIYKISSPKGMDDMRKILSDNGIKFRTIFEDRGKSNVTIFDKGSELLSKVNSVLEVANATGQIIKGVGEFIGGDSRIQGEQAYRKVITDYETKFPTRTRHRFARGFWLHYNGGAYQLGDNCGTGSGGFKEGNTCAKSGAGGATMTPSWAKENPEKASKETAKNTTLYHGTSATLLKSIKEKGLLPSKSGVWGGGKVYSTDSLDLAMEYGVLRATSGKEKIQGKTLIGIVSVLAEGFQSVADNIPTTKAQKMGKTGLAAVSKIFTKDGAVTPSSIRKFDIFDFDSIRKYVYENGPKPRPLATKELEDGSKYVYVPILIEIPEGQEDENLAYAIGGGGAPAGTIPTAVIQGQGKERKFSAYTKPKLRERIKNRILRGTKGGKAGQWSARKAQLVAQAYEKAGGGYTGKRTKAQAGLKKWTKEKWRTSDNSKSIQRGKPTKRYLPSRVWDKLTPAEKASANRSKAKGAKKGKQFVPNPPSVTKKFSYNGQSIDLNCGTGSGGFKEGNTCAKGGGGKGGGGKAKKESDTKDKSERDQEKLLKEIDAEIERLESEPKAKEAVRKMRELRDEVAKAEGIDPELAQATRWSMRDPSRYVQDKDIMKTFNNPTPEHKKWIDEIKASELNPNAKSDNPIAVILMGSPASGKTTTGRPFAQKILGGKETTKIDPDSIKAKSKGFEGWNAGAFHEESSILAEKEIFPKAVSERHNILLDITGKNSDKVAGMARTLKSLGYTIGLVHVDVDDKVALKRASSRFNKPNGRWVPYRYIKGSAEKARNTWSKLTRDGIADIGYSIDGNAERVQGQDAPIRETYGKIE
jgi:adenylate kinase family enzyme